MGDARRIEFKKMDIGNQSFCNKYLVQFLYPKISIDPNFNCYYSVFHIRRQVNAANG
jgi:hypothetical protein